MRLFNKYRGVWSVCENSLDTIYPYIKDYSFYMDKAGNIVVTNTEKEDVPAFCCHLDTVHRAAPVITCLGEDFLVSFNGQGVGGDDKCGIVACLELLKSVECKCIFFRQEEHGCVGSKQFDTKTLSKNLFLIEIDRKGNKDLIFNSGGQLLCSDDFKKAVKKCFPKYEEARGIMTDVNVLGKAGINMMNVSSGYYNPHTKEEYVCLSDLQRTINCLIKFAKEYKTQEKYVRIEEKRVYYPKTNSSFDSIKWTEPIQQENESDESLLRYMQRLGYAEKDF